MTLNAIPGDAAADAFVTLAAFKAYCDATGRLFTTYTDAQIEAAIRRGTTYLSVAFAWQGSRRFNRGQSLAWPRVNVVDGDGFAVDFATIPPEVVNATCEAAWYQLSTGDLLPTVVLANLVSKRSAGGSSITYGSTTAQSVRPTLLLIEDMVAGLLGASSGALNGILVRG